MTFRIASATLWVLALFLSPLGVSSISTIGHSEMLGVVESDDPIERISVVVRVAGGISASDLLAELDSTCVTLHERRQKGVLLLLDRAEQTQGDVLLELRELESQGLAANIEIKWLTNSIAVDLAPSEVARLAVRHDVIDVFEPPTLLPMEPVFRKDAPSHSMGSTGGVEDNLRFIGADSAWAMGYTGEGRIICVFDYTGVDGNHPALRDSWKGRDGDSAAAWIGGGAYPTASGDHGTLITGVLIGHDDESGDTVGVAPGARWIGAAGPAWEWAANPDGDPNTTDDVPDAINISFGTQGSGSCSDGFWDEIDYAEALGAVVIIAAGNRGPGGMTIASPGSRAEDTLTNFAVGSVHHVDAIVSAFSSRGPSGCDSVSVKPNLTAPGGSIRTSSPNGQYIVSGGTSLSAPHIAGAVAILRQHTPDATAREVKMALLAGCVPVGSSTPNNDYGWGIINIPSSLDYLTELSQAELRVWSFDYTPAVVGEVIAGELTIVNRGRTIDSVYAVFRDRYVGLSVLTDSILFGRLAPNESSQGGVPIGIVFDDTLYPGPTIDVSFLLCGSGGQVFPCTLNVQAGIAGERSFFTHTNERLQVTVSNFGEFGFASGSYRSLGYPGVRLSGSTRNWLYQGALMIATDSDHVSDGFRDSSRNPDEDFWIDAGQQLRVSIPGALADQETHSLFDDGLAENRIGIRIEQKTLSWDDPPGDRFVLIEYAMENISREAIEGLLVGLCFDWTFHGTNWDYSCEGDFSPEEDLGYLYHISTTGGSSPPYSDTLWYRGLAVLNREGALSHRVLVQPVSASVPAPGVSDTLKYGAMSQGIGNSIVAAGVGESLLHILSTGPFTLQPGECDTAAFAVIGADSLSEMKTIALRAKEKWRSIVNSHAQPRRFSLDGNHPNPFNAQTTISYTLLDPAHVTLEVYNILGQRVETILDRAVPSGRWTAIWDGHSFASGIYFVRMEVGGVVRSEKMVLLK